jgi:predicted AAA+ superfamily ATPase
MVAGYAKHLGLEFDPQDALTWATQRGARSGRVAWHYAVELAGRAGKTL